MQEAIYRGSEGRHAALVVETRTSANEEWEVFTSLDGAEYRGSDVYDLVGRIPGLKSLSFTHHLSVEWGTATKAAELIEIFRPAPAGKPAYADALMVKLLVEGQEYTSGFHDSLNEALAELRTANIEVRLHTCIHCDFAGYASDYGNGDREYWCYRDAPLAYADYRQLGRYPASEHRFTGRYYVDAFHTCGAWRLRQRPPTKPQT